MDADKVSIRLEDGSVLLHWAVHTINCLADFLNSPVNKKGRCCQPLLQYRNITVFRALENGCTQGRGKIAKIVIYDKEIIPSKKKFHLNSTESLPIWAGLSSKN